MGQSVRYIYTALNSKYFHAKASGFYECTFFLSVWERSEYSNAPPLTVDHALTPTSCDCQVSGGGHSNEPFYFDQSQIFLFWGQDFLFQALLSNKNYHVARLFSPIVHSNQYNGCVAQHPSHDWMYHVSAQICFHQRFICEMVLSSQSYSK